MFPLFIQLMLCHQRLQENPVVSGVFRIKSSRKGKVSDCAETCAEETITQLHNKTWTLGNIWKLELSSTSAVEREPMFPSSL